MRIGRIELILASLASLSLYVFLAVFAPGGPLSTDILWYMNVGLNNIKDTFILNRYFHVFLEKIFLEVAPNPLIGVQHYWAFLIAATAFLIYFCARTFSNKSTLFHAGFAVAIFFSLPEIADSAGVAFVDITAMFMVMLMLTIYLIYARREQRSSWLIALLGFIFYLAFKTKETTLIAGVLFVGLGFQGKKNFNVTTFLKNMRFLVIGFLAGVVVFAIWNWVVLGDPLFGLRPSEIRDFLSTYVKGAEEAQNRAGFNTWYTGYLFPFLLFPFLYYLLSGLKTNNIDLSRRLVWLIPLALILFVTVTVDNQWGYQARFFLPAMPVISILGPQLLDFGSSTSLKSHLKICVILVVGMMMLFFIRAFLRHVTPAMGWDVTQYLEVVYNPILLTLIFAAVLVVDRLSVKVSILLSILMIALLISPILRNYKTMVVQRSNQESSNEMFYPFSAFGNEIQYTPDMQMYLSRGPWDVMGSARVAKNVDEVLSLYNVYFDANSQRDNFYLSDAPSSYLHDILSADYTYVLLSMAEWQDMTGENPQTRNLVEQEYQVFYDTQNLIVLLKAK